MAKTARIYATVDVNYFEDDRVLEAGDAWQLHFAAILACKRQLSDGTLTRRQLAHIAPDSLPDIARSIDDLIRVGLFIDKGDVIAIHGWHEWNDSAEDIEAIAKGGKWGNHLRWHVRRDRLDESCDFCMDRGDSPPDSPPDSQGDRPPNPRSDQSSSDQNISDHTLAPTSVEAKERLRSAILKACFPNLENALDRMTPRERGGLNTTVKGVHDAGGTAEQVDHAATAFHALWPKAVLKPTAFLNNWTTLLNWNDPSELIGLIEWDSADPKAQSYATWVSWVIHLALTVKDEEKARSELIDYLGEIDDIDDAMNFWRARRDLVESRF